LKAGADSIEHGHGLDDETLASMARKGVYWCPTIYVTVYVAPGRAAAGAPIWNSMVELQRQAFGKALRRGVKISYGTDAGGYAWTENQAKELSYMVRYGMTPMQALQSATSVAAALLGKQDELAGGRAPPTWWRSRATCWPTSRAGRVSFA
jgi:imidazolonepropionase-like amidohydrolase